MNTPELDVKQAEHLVEEYGKHKQENLYKSVMNVIVNKSKDKFMEVKKMCEALEELMKDELEERENRGKAIGKAIGKAMGKAESIIEILGDLGTVPKELKERILEEQDLDVLNKWLKQAVKAKSIEDFENQLS